MQVASLPVGTSRQRAGALRQTLRTMAQRQIDTVIFDLGGVLAATGRHSDFTKRFPDADSATLLQILVGDFEVDSDHPWHRLERGEITLAENRRLNREALLAAGIELPPPPPANAPMIQWELNEPVVQLARDLKSAGLTLGVLTNNVLEFRASWWPMLPFDEMFDDVVDSHEVGMRKPSPAIYQLALGRLGAEAARTAFLDDLPANVAGAEAVGMRGVLVGEDPLPAVATVRSWAGLD